MKIFLGSVTNIDHHNAGFEKLVIYLKNSHHLFHYIHKPDSPNSSYDFYEIVEEIQKADVFIAEMSRSSQTLGFQLAHALQLSKPCLYLYDSTLKNRPQGLIGNIPSRGLRFREYDPTSYKKVIDEFMRFAERQMLTTRTSFMSTKEIDEFVSNESKRQGLSKGELIRQLLHRSIST